jgi:hypothetical protein
MPGVKMVPITDDDGNKVANRFEPSGSFLASLGRNYVEMRGADGHAIRANKKLISHYTDKGFVEVAGAKQKAKE